MSEEENSAASTSVDCEDGSTASKEVQASPEKQPGSHRGPTYLNTELSLCLLGSLADNVELTECAQVLGLQVVECDWNKHIGNQRVVFVVDEFEGAEFHDLKEKKHKILGPTALRQYSQMGPTIPIFTNLRPTFCLSMLKAKVVLSGFSQKAHVQQLGNLVHKMGGKCNHTADATVTHLIAKTTRGEKYNYCKKFMLPVLTEDYLWHLWEYRHDPTLNSENKDLLKQFRLRPFSHLKMHFYGFDDKEQNDFVKCLQDNSGTLINDLSSEELTHVVVNHHEHETLTSELQQLPEKVIIVTEPWFWECIQHEYRQDEEAHLLRPTKKRKNDVLSPRESREHKRKGSLSTSQAMSHTLDSTADLSLSPSKDEVEDATKTKKIAPAVPTGKPDKRRLIFEELVTTEEHYVRVLKIILHEYRDSLQSEIDAGNEFVDDVDMKQIFGDIAPIFNVHEAMLSRLKGLQQNWTADSFIGKAIVAQFTNGGMRQAYSTFLKHYEERKQLIEDLAEKNDKFHAFLNLHKARLCKETGKQSLVELLIRPVQRLPSLMLLLKDLLKHTGENHADHQYLKESLQQIEETLHQLNDDKRTFETKAGMVKLYHEIENCPVGLISYSRRSLEGMCDVIDVKNAFVKKGDVATLCLFNDRLLVVKKRSSRFPSIRSPSTTSLQSLKFSGTSSSNYIHKPYKFVTELQLSHIKQILDVCDNGKENKDSSIGSCCLFALKCRRQDETKETLYLFQLIDSVAKEKSQFLRTMAKHVANIICLPNPDTLFLSVDSTKLTEPSGPSTSMLDDVRGYISKMSRVGTISRAFSFRGTPIKRTQSTLLLPNSSEEAKRQTEMSPSISVENLKQERSRFGSFTRLGRSSKRNLKYGGTSATKT